MLIFSWVTLDFLPIFPAFLLVLLFPHPSAHTSIHSSFHQSTHTPRRRPAQRGIPSPHDQWSLESQPPLLLPQRARVKEDIYCLPCHYRNIANPQCFCLSFPWHLTSPWLSFCYVLRTSQFCLSYIRMVRIGPER